MAGPASRSKKERDRVSRAGTGGRESGGEGEGGNGKLGAAIGDARFSRLHTDPRFQRMPKSKTKVSIDSRFASIFQDDIIKDARGGGSKSSDLVRPLRRYYKRDDESAEDEPNDDEASDGDRQAKKPVGEKKRSKRNESKKNENDLTDEGNAKSKKKSAEKIRPDSRSVAKIGKRNKGAAKVGLGLEEPDDQVQGVGVRARERFPADEDLGLGNELGPSEGQDIDEKDELSSASSSSSSSSESESDVEEADFSDADDEQKVATTSEETRRLAMVHMDWEHIRATDLLVLARSFVPRSGSVLSVTIYPSEFGIEQMKKENVHGPQSAFRAQDEEDDDSEEGADLEKLREYEKSKLEYYYAVVECDSAATAAHLYKECDGLEFERTSNTLDLRFIPDALEFKHTPRDTATEAPAEYKPIEFETRALQHSNVKLTWDDDEPVRKKALRRNFNAEELNEMDFRDYVASSSGSDSEFEAADGGTEMAHVDGSKDGKEETEKTEDIRKKYHALLANTEQSDFVRGKKAEKGNIEIKFNIGLDELSEKLLKKAQRDKADETVWEAYLRRKQEKRNARKSKRNVSADSDTSSEEGGVPNQSQDDAFFSHGDKDPFDDPFFANDDEGNVRTSEVKRGKGRKEDRMGMVLNGSTDRDTERKNKKEEASRQKKEAEKKAGELELLLLDDHLVQNGELLEGPSGVEVDEGKQKSKKKKGAKSRNATLPKKVASSPNYEDPRFASLFTSHHFSLDPTDPHYSKAVSHAAELQRQRFQASKNAKEQPDKDVKYDRNQKEKSELFSLARSLKSKVQTNATGKKRKHS